MNHRDLEGYFRVKLGEVTAIDDGEEQDPEIKAVLDLGLPPFDSYVEILTTKTFKARVMSHKKLMAGLCGLNKEDGFLHGGRGVNESIFLGTSCSNC